MIAFLIVISLSIGYFTLSGLKPQIELDPKIKLKLYTNGEKNELDRNNAYARAGELLTFDGTTSHGPIKHYIWDFGSITGKFIITTGDILKVLKHNDPKKVAFLMPQTHGPCRFGQYNKMQKIIIRN